ncbi:MAG: prepilin peptidase [Eubacteriales bacterium]
MELERMVLTIIYLYIFVIGCLIGSFLNVIVYRLPIGREFVKTRSACPQCGTQIKAYDLIPVLSYIILGGKCRHCKKSVALRYPLVELFMGILCVGTVWIKGFAMLSLCLCIYAALLVVIGLIDWDTMLILDKLVICVLVMSIPFFMIPSSIQWWERIIGFFVISVPLLLCTLCINGAFGGGDIKLMAVSGLILGIQNSIVAFLIAILTGGGYAMYLLFIRRVGKKQHMPFGPFLCVGCYVAALWGEELIRWYVQFL